MNCYSNINYNCNIYINSQTVARGGITVELRLNYYPEVRAKAKVCGESANVNYHACVDAHHSSSSNRIRLSAWYQIRSVRVRWCGSWVSKIHTQLRSWYMSIYMGHEKS